MLPNPPISEQQLRFIEEYIADPTSHTQAAINAGYSEDSAKQQAWNLLNDPRIKKQIEYAQKARARQLGVTKDKIIKKLAQIAFAEAGEALIEDPDTGEWKVVSAKAGEVALTQTRAGDKKFTTVTVKTIKTADQIAALEKLAKFLGLEPATKVEVKTELSLADLVSKSFEETKAPTFEPTVIEQPIPEQLTQEEPV